MCLRAGLVEPLNVASLCKETVAVQACMSTKQLFGLLRRSECSLSPIRIECPIVMIRVSFNVCLFRRQDKKFASQHAKHLPKRQHARVGVSGS